MSQMEEMAVVGSCLVEAAALRKSADLLQPAHFTDQRLGTVFSAMKRFLKEGIEVDVVTLNGWMTPEENEKSGGMATLIEATTLVPTALHVEHYCRLVRKQFYLNRLNALADRIKADPHDDKTRKQMRECWDEIDGMVSRILAMEDGLHVYTAFVEDRMKRDGAVFQSGFGMFDRITNGIGRGDLVTVGARTSRGKTSALISLANRYIERDHRVLFVTGEMTSEQIMDRLVSMRSRIPLSRLRRRMEPSEWKTFTDTLADLHQKPLFIADMPRLTFGKILETIQTTKPDIVMIDYIQQFKVPESYKNNRAAFFSDAAYALKALAKDRHISLFVSSQLNRGIEHRKNDEPTLADLKESGGIEEASDIVVLIHSPENGLAGIRNVSFIVAKNRNGALGKVPFVFFETTTAFQEQEEDLQPVDDRRFGS